MNELLEIKEYRKKQSLDLIEKYKDLISKTFTVVDKDLLQGKIDSDVDENESEQKYLDAIKKRRIALDEVDLILDKIEKLERHTMPDEEVEAEKSKADQVKKNWTKKAAEGSIS